MFSGSGVCGLICHLSYVLIICVSFDLCFDYVDLISEYVDVMFDYVDFMFDYFDFMHKQQDDKYPKRRSQTSMFQTYINMYTRHRCFRLTSMFRTYILRRCFRLTLMFQTLLCDCEVRASCA